MGFTYLVAGVAFLLFVILVAVTTSARKSGKAMELFLSNLDGFSSTSKEYCFFDRLIAIDEEKKSLCVINGNTKEISYRLFSYKDLLSSEIFEDGVSTTKTVRSSQLGGALLGGLLFGGVGAIVGGLSGKTQIEKKTTTIELRIIVNDINNPLCELRFLTANKARHWHGIIGILIKQAEAEDKERVSHNNSKINFTSIADEIKKLAKLRDSGILSADEFQQQKLKLLST